MLPLVLIEIAITLSQGGGAEPPAPACKPPAQVVQIEAPACPAAPAKPGETRGTPRAASAARQ